MSAAALKTLREVLKRGTIDGAYYLAGEDEFQKEDAMRQLITASVEPSTRDFNLDVLCAQDLDARTFEGILSTMPMLADRRVVVIRDVGHLKRDARQALARYLERPSGDILLLLVESPGGKTDRELSTRTTLLEFDTLSGDRVAKWISDYTSTSLKTRITPAAADLLHAAAGADLHQLVTELEKLSSFTKGGKIDEAAVAVIVGITQGETMGDFLDQVALQNVTRALELLPKILNQPKTSGVLLVMALASQVVALSWGRARLEEGVAPTRLQSEYFTFLKQARSAYTGRSWGSAAATWAWAVDRWSADALERAMESLLQADIALKETKFSSEEQVLATLVLSMCVGDDRSIAA